MSPFKPTREDATSSSQPEEMAERALSPGERRPPAGVAQGRESRGTGDGSRRHPPHLTENDRGAPLQEEQESPTEVAALPANASGRESMGAEAQEQGIEETSMYDRRPDEDKDRPPSSRIG